MIKLKNMETKNIWRGNPRAWTPAMLQKDWKIEFKIIVSPPQFLIILRANFSDKQEYCRRERLICAGTTVVGVWLRRIAIPLIIVSGERVMSKSGANRRVITRSRWVRDWARGVQLSRLIPVGHAAGALSAWIRCSTHNTWMHSEWVLCVALSSPLDPVTQPLYEK